MHWIEEWRHLNDVTREELGNKTRCSAALIATLEEQNNAVTHPCIADRIADITEATMEQRDSIVPKKYRGTWTPGERPVRRRAQSEGQKPSAVPYNARGVVCLDRDGRELGRYQSCREAAEQMGCGKSFVYQHCGRKNVKKNELFLTGYTFRYADEWDGMSAAEREADLRQAEWTDPRCQRIVALDDAGKEIGRYLSILKAAIDNQCSETVVKLRCGRKLKAETDEFQVCGRTFRFAEEWDSMSPAERMRDMLEAKNRGHMIEEGA